MPRGHKHKPNAILKVGPPLSERIHPTRRRRYSKKVILEALRASNGMISGAAKRLGCARITVREYFKRYPELEQELQDIRDSFVDLAETSLLAQVQEKNTAATLFLLRCLGKNRGYVENPNVQLHAHVQEGSGTWMDIMSRVMKSGSLPDGNQIIDINPNAKQLPESTDGEEDDGL